MNDIEQGSFSQQEPCVEEAPSQMSEITPTRSWVANFQRSARRRSNWKRKRRRIWKLWTMGRWPGGTTPLRH